MSSQPTTEPTKAEEPPDLRHWEIVDVNNAAGYTIYIVDRWEGDKNDPTVSVTRYIGVWREEQWGESGLADDADPLFWPKDRSRYHYRNDPDSPAALHWAELEVIKKADHELIRFKSDQAGMLDEPRYSYGSQKKRAELYQAFLTGIDLLAKYPDNESAWEMIENWRNYNANLHEK